MSISCFSFACVACRSVFFLREKGEFPTPETIMDSIVRRNDFWYRLGGQALVMIGQERSFSLGLVDGYPEYHRPIITNACPPKRSLKSLRGRFEPIPLIVSVVRNYEDAALAHVPLARALEKLTK